MTLFSAASSSGRRRLISDLPASLNRISYQGVGALRKAGIHENSDERILGHSDFIENVLVNAQESLELKYALAAKGIGFQQLTQWVS
jgi:hypothetical protein